VWTKNTEPITSYDNFVQFVKEKKIKTAYEVVRKNIGVAGEHDKKY